MAKVGACISVRPLTRKCCYLSDEKLPCQQFQDSTHVSDSHRHALATRTLLLDHVAYCVGEVAAVSTMASTEIAACKVMSAVRVRQIPRTCGGSVEF